MPVLTMACQSGVFARRPRRSSGGRTSMGASSHRAMGQSPSPRVRVNTASPPQKPTAPPAAKTGPTKRLPAVSSANTAPV